MANSSNVNQGGAQDQERQPKEQTAAKKELSPAAAGDERTPDKTIGEVKYAGGQKKSEGGAGKPPSSPLEPEKQGGIGGP